jgi:hypothetical protein
VLSFFSCLKNIGSYKREENSDLKYSRHKEQRENVDVVEISLQKNLLYSFEAHNFKQNYVMRRSRFV